MNFRREKMYITVFVTVPSERVGEKIAIALLNEKLAACVNINSKIRSLYWWQGEIQDEQEALLIIKTKLSLFSDLERVVRQNHPYTVPEIIALPIARGFRPYLDWISKETKVSEDDPGFRRFSF